MRKCKACSEAFSPVRSLQVVCSPLCAIKFAKKAACREERKAIREARKKAKTRADHMREAQAAFNAWVRARDAGQPCISCGRHHQGQLHAGHYRSVRSEPALRFEPDNCHLQCAPCNTHLSGNLIPYRANLIKKIGIARVEWLESHHEPKKYMIEELKRLKSDYKQKLKELKREREYEEVL